MTWFSINKKILDMLKEIGETYIRLTHSHSKVPENASKSFTKEIWKHDINRTSNQWQWVTTAGVTCVTVSPRPCADVKLTKQTKNNWLWAAVEQQENVPDTSLIDWVFGHVRNIVRCVLQRKKKRKRKCFMSGAIQSTVITLERSLIPGSWGSVAGHRGSDQRHLPVLPERPGHIGDNKTRREGHRTHRVSARGKGDGLHRMVCYHLETNNDRNRKTIHLKKGFPPREI